MPNWFHNFPKLSHLNLVANNITGTCPFEYFPPDALFSLVTLVLRNNSFSGEVPSNIGDLMPNIRFLDLSRNSITAEIPASVCNFTGLELLKLSFNHLSRHFPHCSWKNLRYLDLESNNLTGKIPSDLSLSRSLNFLKLKNNNFYGEIPSFLELKVLVTLDLGENRLSGDTPMWIGEGLSSLRVLRLRSNLFTGHLPPQLCYLSYLQVIDLGHNKLSGPIPSCFGNLSTLEKVGEQDIHIDVIGRAVNYQLHLEDMGVVVIKGTQLGYSKNLRFLKSIDLSRNNLSGEIPVDLTRLLGLNILNLSMNHLNGKIPPQIGKLKQLESLDLSQNSLSGTIPPSLSDLNFLNHLNLSNNDLSGRILSGNQLQILNNDLSVYDGNPQLCGPPLPKSCLGDEVRLNSTLITSGIEDEDGKDIMGFYISLGTGFVFGFCGICGTLLLSESTKRAYFQFIAVRIYRLKRALSMIL